MTTIKSVEKVIDILDCFRADKPVLGVNEISQMTGFTKSTVSRLLATMENKGCLERTGDNGRYRLGVKFYIWGNIVQQQQTGLTAVARPVMEKLRDECGEEVSLYVMENESRICLLKVESKYGVAKVSTTGVSLPLHCGASGRVLLAYLPEAERERLIRKEPLKQFTPFTIIDPDQLSKNLEQVRKQGYAISTNEREIGAYSVVAPVRDGSNEVIASLAISGPSFRLSEEQLQKNLQLVLEAAKNISVKLGSTVLE
ncbi:MAG: IclR family transcriptional regulator [Bacillota bacterium]